MNLARESKSHEETEKIRDLVFSQWLGNVAQFLDSSELPSLSRLSRSTKRQINRDPQYRRRICEDKVSKGFCVRPEVQAQCHVQCDSALKRIVAQLVEFVGRASTDPGRFSLLLGPPHEGLEVRAGPVNSASFKIYNLYRIANFEREEGWTFLGKPIPESQVANAIVARFTSLESDGKMPSPVSLQFEMFGLFRLNAGLPYLSVDQMDDVKYITVIDKDTLLPVLPNLPIINSAPLLTLQGRHLQAAPVDGEMDPFDAANLDWHKRLARRLG